MLRASDKPSAKQFSDAFFKRWGRSPTYHDAAAMASLYHLEGAIMGSGVGDGPGLKASMDAFSTT